MIKTFFLLLSFLVTICPVFSQNIALEVRAFSEGFYRPSLGQMIPIVGVSYHSDYCDTAFVTVFDSLHTSILCEKIMVKTSGYGCLSLPENFTNKKVYVGVRFRNTLSVSSKSPVVIERCRNLLDLTRIENVNFPCDTTDGVAKALSGELSKDGFIDVLDYAELDVAAAEYVENPDADLNGDGVVDGADFILLEKNILLLAEDVYFNTCGFSDGVPCDASPTVVLFPNPARGYAQVRVECDISYEKPIVYDLHGSSIPVKISFSGNKAIIDLAGVRPGLYFLKPSSIEKQSFLLVIE